VDNIDSFLGHRVENLTAEATIPVNLAVVAQQINAIVEEREMIPEAALQAKGGQFHIYLQSNFTDNAGLAQRRRFSLAHEIAHTFFFEVREGELKPRKGGPTGDKLEMACQKAAALLLVPERLVKSELRRFGAVDAHAVADLATRFDVSVEVMLRRLNEIGVFQSGFAPVLTRRGHGGRFEIEYAVYPVWLRSRLVAPKRGTDFSKWFRPDNEFEGTLVRASEGGQLTAKPVDVTNSLRIFQVLYETL
jgi:Zn-dependent peptidase ImmA (M78 family)